MNQLFLILQRAYRNIQCKLYISRTMVFNAFLLFFPPSEDVNGYDNWLVLLKHFPKAQTNRCTLLHSLKVSGLNLSYHIIVIRQRARARASSKAVLPTLMTGTAQEFLGSLREGVKDKSLPWHKPICVCIYIYLHRYMCKMGYNTHAPGQKLSTNCLPLGRNLIS